MPDTLESVVYSSIVNPKNQLKKTLEKTLLVSIPQLRNIRVSLERSNSSYKYLEDFYGDSLNDIYNKLRGLKTLSRTSSKKNINLC